MQKHKFKKQKNILNAAKIFDNTELDTEQMKTAGKIFRMQPGR